jgi:hypothetical protein
MSNCCSLWIAIWTWNFKWSSKLLALTSSEYHDYSTKYRKVPSKVYLNLEN